MKVIVLPSGDQTGSKSPPGTFGRGVKPEPSALITNKPDPRYNSWFVSQGDVKTRRIPSGDQAGWHAPSGISVICRGSLAPSTSNIHIWVVPLRSEAKAISPLPPPIGAGVEVGVGSGRVGVGVEVPVGSVVDVSVGSWVKVGEGIVSSLEWKFY